MQSASVINEYLTKLRQAAWRLQYYERKRLKHEFIYDYTESNTYVCKAPNLVEEIGLKETIRMIPYPQGRTIIYEIFVNDKTEKEIAQEMHITQQAVSKWKKKSLTYLCQTLSS